MMEQVNSKNFTVSLDLKALESLFEIDLKPLRNAYARLLYAMFIESTEVEHLTTLDIQNKLQGNNLNLHKKEINSWLSSLQTAGLITKEYERGKPTTINYKGRYTYDLWLLTEKGQDIAKKIMILYSEKTSYNSDENVLNVANLKETDVVNDELLVPHADWFMFCLLRTITNSKNLVTLNDLRELISPSPEAIIKLISQGSLNGLLTVEIARPSSIMEKIFRYLGISNKQKYLLQVTKKGEHILLNGT